MTNMQQKVYDILEEAGEEGVHSFYFYRRYIPTIAQRISELIRDGYKIIRIKHGSKGATYFLKG